MDYEPRTVKTIQHPKALLVSRFVRPDRYAEPEGREKKRQREQTLLATEDDIAKRRREGEEKLSAYLLRQQQQKTEERSKIQKMAADAADIDEDIAKIAKKKLRKLETELDDLQKEVETAKLIETRQEQAREKRKMEKESATMKKTDEEWTKIESHALKELEGSVKKYVASVNPDGRKGDRKHGLTQAIDIVLNTYSRGPGWTSKHAPHKDPHHQCFQHPAPSGAGPQPDAFWRRPTIENGADAGGAWNGKQYLRNTLEEQRKLHAMNGNTPTMQMSWHRHVPRHDARPGDYECRNCGGYNYAFRNICYQCGNPRPRQEPGYYRMAQRGRGGQRQLPGRGRGGWTTVQRGRGVAWQPDATRGRGGGLQQQLRQPKRHTTERSEARPDKDRHPTKLFSKEQFEEFYGGRAKKQWRKSGRRLKQAAERQGADDGWGESQEDDGGADTQLRSDPERHPTCKYSRDDFDAYYGSTAKKQWRKAGRRLKSEAKAVSKATKRDRKAANRKGSDEPAMTNEQKAVREAQVAEKKASDAVEATYLRWTKRDEEVEKLTETLMRAKAAKQDAADAHEEAKRGMLEATAKREQAVEAELAAKKEAAKEQMDEDETPSQKASQTGEGDAGAAGEVAIITQTEALQTQLAKERSMREQLNQTVAALQAELGMLRTQLMSMRAPPQTYAVAAAAAAGVVTPRAAPSGSGEVPSPTKLDAMSTKDLEQLGTKVGVTVGRGVKGTSAAPC